MIGSDTGAALVEMHAAGRTYIQGGVPVAALHSATGRIDRRDRIAITGPSGSGKSTLLHLLAGLDHPTSGTISWPALGPSDGLRPRHVAIAFQTPSLIPTLSVIENVELPLLLGDSPRSTGARDRARTALDLFSLGDLAEKLPEELSGGQAQRVALARATVAGPSLLLADEPTGQLDHATADGVLAALLGWGAAARSAIVVATHDLAVARAFDLTWRMEHGRLAAPEWSRP